MVKWGLLALGIVSLLVGGLIWGCTVYQQAPEPVKPPVKAEAAQAEKTALIPEEVFDGVLERFKRRDVALDLQQAHTALYPAMQKEAQVSQGTDLDGTLYALALSYLDQLSLDTARAVLKETEQPENEKNIRELVSFSNNTEKARMIVLFEMEYLKSDGLVAESD